MSQPQGFSAGFDWISTHNHLSNTYRNLIKLLNTTKYKVYKIKWTDEHEVKSIYTNWFHLKIVQRIIIIITTFLLGPKL